MYVCVHACVYIWSSQIYLYALTQIPVAVELVETTNGTIYYITDPSVFGDAPNQQSDDPSNITQPDGIFLTQDEGKTDFSLFTR